MGDETLNNLYISPSYRKVIEAYETADKRLKKELGKDYEKYLLKNLQEYVHRQAIIVQEELLKSEGRISRMKQKGKEIYGKRISQIKEARKNLTNLI